MAVIAVVFISLMVAVRRERACLRAANLWFRREDPETETWDAENIFAIRELHARSEGWLEQEERQAFLRGGRWESGSRPSTLRARWIRALRDQAREFAAQEEECGVIYDLEDLWDLKILFGDAPLRPTSPKTGTWRNGPRPPRKIIHRISFIN
ncbi:uncharacterized protein [Fopius arisanus]|uniref:Uncharacterized protein n=1 Tax=Fopius arisanus TaxID=64838 RepID=A0A9R1SZ51_9HYME|nr:PREDICTED: uncharacterized protein LOC105264488 [Fopius arisanus]